MDELNDILEGEEQPVAEPQEQPEVTEEAPETAEAQSEGQPRSPDGKFAPKGNKEDAMPASEEKHVPIQSYQAEKQKRQEWETRYRDDVEALRREIEALKQPPKQPEPAPDIWENTTGWESHFGQQVTAQAVQQATYQSKLQMSELMARQAHQDFDEVWQPMNDFLKANPSVIEQATQAAHPWEHAYKAYKNFTTMQELGATDIDSLKAQLLEQLKAEQAQQPSAALPKSLADAQSARGPAPTAKPLSLDDILGG